MTGLARPVCYCGQCFNEHVKHFQGLAVSESEYASSVIKILLDFCRGKCPKRPIEN